MSLTIAVMTLFEVTCLKVGCQVSENDDNCRVLSEIQFVMTCLRVDTTLVLFVEVPFPSWREARVTSSRLWGSTLDRDTSLS